MKLYIVFLIDFELLFRQPRISPWRGLWLTAYLSHLKRTFGKESSKHGLAKELFHEYLALPKKVGVV